MKVRCVVTKNDIKKGIACDSHSCPIALSITRAINSANYSVEVTKRYINFNNVADGKLRYSISDVPAKVEDFINNYDNSIGFKSVSKPMWFVLDIPVSIVLF